MTKAASRGAAFDATVTKSSDPGEFERALKKAVGAVGYHATAIASLEAGRVRLDDKIAKAKAHLADTEAAIKQNAADLATEQAAHATAVEVLATLTPEGI